MSEVTKEYVDALKENPAKGFKKLMGVDHYSTRGYLSQKTYVLQPLPRDIKVVTCLSFNAVSTIIIEASSTSRPSLGMTQIPNSLLFLLMRKN